jgi:hypothetical protein
LSQHEFILTSVNIKFEVVGKVLGLSVAVTPDNARSRLILALIASSSLAFLALLHQILYLALMPYAPLYDLLPYDLRLPLQLFFLPTFLNDLEEKVICYKWRVYAMLALPFSFALYTLLYYMLDLGLSAIVGRRYEILAIYALGVAASALNGLIPIWIPSFYYATYTIPNVVMEAGFRSILYCNNLEIDTSLIIVYPLVQSVIPSVLLALALFKVYRRTMITLFLAPPLIAIARIVIPIALFILAIVGYKVGLPTLPLSEFNIFAALLFFHELYMAPAYGVMLWGSLAALLLHFVRAKSQTTWVPSNLNGGKP